MVHVNQSLTVTDGQSDPIINLLHRFKYIKATFKNLIQQESADCRDTLISEKLR